jgi:hypothetical protein
MASPWLEKMQRISPLVPVNDEFYLRRKDRFDKSARKKYLQKLLVTSAFLVTLFRMF